jgi:NTP pyrophosphatase (non-canonical NTP hydrolase)
MNIAVFVGQALLILILVLALVGLLLYISVKICPVTNEQIIRQVFEGVDIEKIPKISEINNFFDYERIAMSTKVGWNKNEILYPLVGMCGETGEVADKIKKVIRDKNGNFSKEDKIEILKEIGDTLWYMTALCQDLGYTLKDAANINLEKVTKRREENTIHGEGDNR